MLLCPDVWIVTEAASLISATIKEGNAYSYSTWAASRILIVTEMSNAISVTNSAQDINKSITEITIMSRPYKWYLAHPGFLRKPSQAPPFLRLRWIVSPKGGHGLLAPTQACPPLGENVPEGQKGEKGLWKEIGAARKNVGRTWYLCLLPFVLFVVWLVLPVRALFPECYSRAIYDANGQLLRAMLADDGQLRFPVTTDSLPGKYIVAVTSYEDKRFFSHWGVDPLALAHAALTNLTHGERLRGGSTITMQVVRLAHPRKRTYLSKFIECCTALRLSLHFSKTEILKLYAAHVPMGGNTVGIEAASYRYFGKPLREITWAEAALFSVLPNSPSMINLAHQRHLLKEKRDRLLALLNGKGVIDSLTLRLACTEPLPDPGQSMPFIAPHFTSYVLHHYRQPILRTTLDAALQEQVTATVRSYSNLLKQQGINNLSVLVVETQTGKVRAYLGSYDFFDTLYGGQVDGIQAFRSTGSLLKPFLVAQALDRGPFCMASKLQDVPTFYGTFSPRNASKEFSSLVTMEDMLIQSLNVPAVRLLHYFGLEDFYHYLKSAGLAGLFRTPEGYGLSLILGGAEASLWELTRLFAGLGNLGMQRPLAVIQEDYHDDGAKVQSMQNPVSSRLCSEGAAWLVLRALRKLARPGSEYYWYLFAHQVPVSWKTGTSYGQKDAWAIGTNRQWTIGVWVGNFTGEGNAMLSGARSAGPMLFSLFNQLSDKSQPLWFEMPEHDLIARPVCPSSGYTPGPWCPEAIYVQQPLQAYRTRICPFHQRFLVNPETGCSVCSRCWTDQDTAWVVKEIYPPSVQAILQALGHKVDSLPAHNPACPAVHRKNGIEIVYPIDGVGIFVPRNLQGTYEKVVLKANHQRQTAHLFWYLNNGFIGETVEQHSLTVDLAPGDHRLVVQDNEGSMRSVAFRAFRTENSSDVLSQGHQME